MRIGMRTVKTVISVFFSMVTAGSLSLLYWTAAGIIALLSVGNTKCSTLRTGMNRIAAFILATATALISFFAVGYTIFGFSLFLFLFIPLASRFKLTEGIVVNSVLVTHYLVEENMSWQLIGNEAGLMAIGLVFALLANVYMPDRTKQPGLKRDAKRTSKKQLLRPERSSRYIYETYFSMRRAQANVIKDMLENLERIQQPAYYGKHIYGLLIYTAETFSESNDGRQILTRIEEVYVLYRQMPLPTSRPEFEDRAELFQFLQSFKSFIEIKAEFSQQKIQK
ncbi:aromatic acid exporter family protein [Enterococcus faecium]|nr:aromatic acid exporter family protein [Enterococcus faecium]